MEYDLNKIEFVKTQKTIRHTNERTYLQICIDCIVHNGHLQISALEP